MADEINKFRRFRRGISLRGRLMLLVLVGIVPLLIFNFGYQYIEYRSDVAATGTRTLALARTMSQLIEGELNARVLALQTLASDRALHDNDVEAFRQRAQIFVDGQFPGANIVLLRPDGQMIMNLRMRGVALPVRPDLGSIRQVLTTGAPSVSNLFEGARTARLVLAIDVPVKADDGSIRYVLTMNPSLDIFDAIIRRQHFPESWVVSVFDRKAVIAARFPNAIKFVGHEASSTLFQPLQTRDEGILDTTSLEGANLQTAFSHGDQFGWAVAIGIPHHELTGPVISSAVKTFGAGCMMLVIGLALAHFASRSIAGSINSLRLFGAAPDAIPANPPPGGLPEADNVAAASTRA